MAIIVGLAGPGQVGKSTTAKNIVMAFNVRGSELNVARYAFAQPIYEIAASLTGIPIDYLKNEVYKETVWTKATAPLPSLVGWSPRKFLQVIGTECFRNNVNSNFWIEAAIKKVSHLDIAIIEDARFPNEFERCNMVIELERDGVEYAKNHPSAMPPDPKYVDYRIKLSHGMSYEPIVNLIINHDYLKKGSNAI